MSDAQRRSYENLSARFVLSFIPRSPLSTAPGKINYQTIFDNSNPVTVEIGFGMGTATSVIAEANPHKNYLGLEVHTPGVGKLLWEIEQRGLGNIRIIEHDAVEVLEGMIADESVAAFHIFFPDPWPKKRHHKRRLIQRPFTDLLARKLMPGGYVYMVTDWVEYGDWALAELGATPELKNAFEGFSPPQTWRPQTKFERKGLAKKHEVRELYFLKDGFK